MCRYHMAARQPVGISTEDAIAGLSAGEPQGGQLECGVAEAGARGNPTEHSHPQPVEAPAAAGARQRDLGCVICTDTVGALDPMQRPRRDEQQRLEVPSPRISA